MQFAKPWCFDGIAQFVAKKNQPHYTVRVTGLDPHPAWVARSWLNSAGNLVCGVIEGNDSASIRVTAAGLLRIK